jgi:hypothetical protein
MFAEAIAQKYRLVRTQHGTGEEDAEYSIPLGSWRKGRGMEGSKGHVYEYGPGWAGVWIKGRSPGRKIAPLAIQFSNLRTMQVSDHEATFRVPIDDLDALLPILNAKRLPAMTEARKSALSKARQASPLAFTRGHKAKNAPGSTP